MKNVILRQLNSVLYVMPAYDRRVIDPCKIGYTRDLKARINSYRSHGHLIEDEEVGSRFGDRIDEIATQTYSRDYKNPNGKKEDFVNLSAVRIKFYTEYKIIYSDVLDYYLENNLFTVEDVIGDRKVENTALFWRGVIYKFGDTIEDIIDGINKLGKTYSILEIAKQKLKEALVIKNISQIDNFEEIFFNYLTAFNNKEKQKLRSSIHKAKYLATVLNITGKRDLSWKVIEVLCLKFDGHILSKPCFYDAFKETIQKLHKENIDLCDWVNNMEPFVMPAINKSKDTYTIERIFKHYTIYYYS